MNITFDPQKNLINMSKHLGISLHQAKDFEWETAVVWQDFRLEYEEPRMVALDYICNRLHVMVYVQRESLCRVISLRKANKREEARYAET